MVLCAGNVLLCGVAHLEFWSDMFQGSCTSIRMGVY